MIRVASAVLACLLTAPALLAGPEVPISAVQRQRAAFHQRVPQIATDGTNFLVTWMDERMPDGTAPLYAMRLGPDGKPLDSAPIRLPMAQITTSGMHGVTWTGNVYLVFCMDFGTRTLLWVRIDRDGRVLDPQPRAIAGMTTPHSIASAGGRTLVAFTSDWPEPRLYGQFIEADGTVAGARITFPHAGRSDWSPAVATNGNGFHVTWTRVHASRQDVVGIPVSLDGQLGAERTIATGAYNLYLASNGANYLAAYALNDGSIVTEQLDGSGATLVRTVHQTARPSAGAALAAYGSGYLLVTRETAATVARVLDAGGRETGRLPLDASNSFNMFLVIASHPTATVAVWHEESDDPVSGSDVFAEAVDGRRERVLLSDAAARQTALRVATDGVGFFGAWLETRERPQLRAGRISANGVPLDGEGILVAEHVTETPALTFDGANYVLAWIEKHPGGDCAVRATRLTREGVNLDVNLDRGQVVTRTCTEAIGLGSNGTESLLVLSTVEFDRQTNQWNLRLLANRLHRDLTVGAPVELPSSNLRGLDIAVHAISGMWLVAWTRYYDSRDCLLCNPPPSPEYDVHAVRLSEELALLDGEPLQLSATTVDRAPSIAAAGDEFLVVWERLPDQTIRARRVPRFGMPTDESVVTHGRAPSVVRRAGAYVVAFEENGNLFTTTLGAPGRTAIATSADREHSVRLVSTAGGVMAAYLRIASEPLYDLVDRGFVRMLTPRRRAIRK